MYSYSALLKRITEAFTATPFVHEPRELYEPIAYTLEEGGKRLRPVLVLLACDLFGGNIEKALYPAMGLEIFHNFTLLHDDIMDQAAIRRGKAAVHKKWNANTAILSGDTMFVLAYEYVAKTDPALLPQVMDLFNDSAKKVCEGQQYDMNFETRQDVSISDYMMMIRLKTAVLIACSLKLGAILSHADPETADKIYEFGIHLGLAFQLQDDLLDAFGEVAKFGKTIGGDIVTNKKTFLYIKAFELAREDNLIRLTHYFTDPEILAKPKIEGILELYRLLEIDRITSEEIETQLMLGLEILDSIKVDSDRKRELRDLTLGMMRRES
jgi:geranylgeranyl diphosphate synthase, type II